MRWTKQMTIDFILEYIKHICLYKVNSTFYRNKLKRNAALLQICKRMGIPGFGPKDACNKIRNLRSTYWQEFKKMRKSNGAYTTNLKWFSLLHDAVMVADESEDIREIINSQNYYIESVALLPEASEVQQEENDSDILNPNIVIRIEKDENHFDDSQDDSEIQLEEEHLDGTSDSDVDTKIGILSDTKSVERSCSSQINDLIPETPTITNIGKNPRKRTYYQLLAEQQYVVNRAEQTENEFDIFGKSIAAQLKNMPLEIAIRAQMHMQNYLSGIRLKHTLLKSSESSPSH